MIQALILDVDGVLIGDKNGYNWPSPHPDVIYALKSLRERGMFVSLCTGKGTFAMREIVEAAHLDNLHIGDGGAVVVDFLKNRVIEKHILPSDDVFRMVHLFQEAGVYIELYTLDGYYIEEKNISEITRKQHEDILLRKPIVVKSLVEVGKTLEVVKIMPIAKDEKDKERIIQLFQDSKSSLSLQWGVHPTALPHQFGLLTLPGISKKQAAETISKNTGVLLFETLGIGDGMTDWHFMDICGYAGAMGNAVTELKEKVHLKGNRGYIGTSVNENGVLNIFKHFGLI
ncbi:HAD family phosphatase [Candidatus Gottesmanbacteria bacterium]|nr:HAD family phosphatase [Candidatus Gottesmanbacteria bacterium]